MPKGTRTSHAISSLMLTAALGAGPAGSEIPPTFPLVDDAHRPAWVPVADAIVDGELRPGLLPPSDYERLAETFEPSLERSADSKPFSEWCQVDILTLTSHVGAYRWATTLSELAVDASIIVSGNITDAEAGFFRGAPGTLFELRVDERPTDRKMPGVRYEDVYFFYPSVRIEVDGREICFHIGNRSVRPEIDRRAMLFLRDPPDDPLAIVRMHDSDIVFEAPDGTAVTPFDTATSSIDFSQTERAIRRALRAIDGAIDR